MTQASAPTCKADRPPNGEDEEEGIFSCFRWFPLSSTWSTKTTRKESSNNPDGVGVASDILPLKRDTPRPPKDFTCKAPSCLEVREDRDLINRHMEIKHPELHDNSSKTVISSRQICHYLGCDRSFYVLENLQQHLARHKTIKDIFKTTSPTFQGTPPTDDNFVPS
ncbi:hypothetical protein GQ44DRAFT_770462 [Phaeosphaeriaceae sp. PMI808]|nr:hypothetical protein GQ44DRAFT_770462 [Phaeosphaeriaceae sp. PMI808]